MAVKLLQSINFNTLCSHMQTYDQNGENNKNM